MKVKDLIEWLNTQNPESKVEIHFTHTNHNTCIVPNNTLYKGKWEITKVGDNWNQGFTSVILWGGD